MFQEVDAPPADSDAAPGSTPEVRSVVQLADRYCQRGGSSFKSKQCCCPFPQEDDLAELKRAAQEGITSHRSLKVVLGSADSLEKEVHVVDLRRLGSRQSAKERQLIVDHALATRDQDNARFLTKLRGRMDR